MLRWTLLAVCLSPGGRFVVHPFAVSALCCGLPRGALQPHITPTRYTHALACPTVDRMPTHAAPASSKALEWQPRYQRECRRGGARPHLWPSRQRTRTAITGVATRRCCVQRLLGLALVSEPERQSYVLGILAQAAVAHPSKAAIGAAHGCSIVTRCRPPPPPRP